MNKRDYKQVKQKLRVVYKSKQNSRRKEIEKMKKMEEDLQNIERLIYQSFEENPKHYGKSVDSK